MGPLQTLPLVVQKGTAVALALSAAHVASRGRVAPRGARALRGFTIVELLVVILILVLLLGVAAGSIRSLLASSERSLADQQLRVSIAAARDLALRSNDDAGAFFLFRDGRVSVLPALRVGQIEDSFVRPTGSVRPNGVGQAKPVRDIFAPSYTTSSFTLPVGYSVRGFAAPGTLNDEVTNRNGMYDVVESMPASQAEDGNWVFPETSFFDPTDELTGSQRHTFFVRFEARTGNLVLNNPRPVLLLDVVNSTAFRGAAPFSTNRIDEADELAAFVQQVLGDGTLNPVVVPPTALTGAQQLIGDASPDTILCLPVTELALYREVSLVNGIGARSVNRATGTVYGVAGGATQPTQPRLDTSLFATPPTPEAMQERINDWINIRASGNTNDAPTVNSQFDARIFSVARYLSQLQEVTP
jgi:prepilin-type N-terminal cleavage/methylation domain-containing protein